MFELDYEYAIILRVTLRMSVAFKQQKKCLKVKQVGINRK